MSRKYKDYHVRDLSEVRSKPTGTSRHKTGLLKSSVAPAFKANSENDGQVCLRTRAGRKVDLRTRAGQRFLGLVAGMISDLGGRDNITVSEFQLVRRAAAIAIDLEFQEAEALNAGAPLDVDVFRALAETQRKILQTLGLRRRAREVGQIVTADEALNVIHTRYSTIEAKGDAAD